MSANYIVDLNATTVSYPSLQASGTLWVASGPTGGSIIGNGVDLLEADSFCNVSITGLPNIGSGALVIQIQTSDTDTAANYTDPTSGLATFPTWFSSGGLLWLNSGGLLGGTLQGAINTGGALGNSTGTSGSPSSGYAIASGFQLFAGFQRVGRFARANVLSGTYSSGYAGTLSLGFVSQLRTTGSGGGFTYNPSSGSVNV